MTTMCLNEDSSGPWIHLLHNGVDGSIIVCSPDSSTSSSDNLFIGNDGTSKNGIDLGPFGDNGEAKEKNERTSNESESNSGGSGSGGGGVVMAGGQQNVKRNHRKYSHSKRLRQRRKVRQSISEVVDYSKCSVVHQASEHLIRPSVANNSTNAATSTIECNGQLWSSDDNGGGEMMVNANHHRESNCGSVDYVNHCSSRSLDKELTAVGDSSSSTTTKLATISNANTTKSELGNESDSHSLAQFDQAHLKRSMNQSHSKFYDNNEYSPSSASNNKVDQNQSNQHHLSSVAIMAESIILSQSSPPAASTLPYKSSFQSSASSSSSSSSSNSYLHHHHHHHHPHRHSFKSSTNYKSAISFAKSANSKKSPSKSYGTDNLDTSASSNSTQSSLSNERTADQSVSPKSSGDEMSLDNGSDNNQPCNKTGTTNVTESTPTTTTTVANIECRKAIRNNHPEEESPTDFSDESDARNSSTTDSGNHTNTDSQGGDKEEDDSSSSNNNEDVTTTGDTANVEAKSTDDDQANGGDCSSLPGSDSGASAQPETTDSGKCLSVDSTSSSGGDSSRVDSNLFTTNSKEEINDSNNNNSSSNSSNRDNSSDDKNFDEEDDDDDGDDDDSDSQLPMKQATTGAGGNVATVSSNNNVTSGNQFDFDQTSNNSVGPGDAGGDEDDYHMMHNFDPVEVLKRMKVELKEEFDDNERTDIGGADNSCDKVKDLSRNHFDFTPNAPGTAGGGGGGYSDNDYLRKVFAGFDLAPSSADLTDSLFPKDSIATANNSSLAAFAAAAVASSSLFNDSFASDASKHHLFQALFMKNLNGNAEQADINPAADMNSLASIGALLGEKYSPQHLLSAMGAVSGLNGRSDGSSVAFPYGQTTNNLLSFHEQNNNNNKCLPKIDDPEQRYCSSCNIQFKSIKTFKVHKELYCSSRHQNSLTAAVDSVSGTPGSMTSTHLKPNCNMTYGSNGSSNTSKLHQLFQQNSNNLKSPPPALNQSSNVSRKRSVDSGKPDDDCSKNDFLSQFPNFMLNQLNGVMNESTRDSFVNSSSAAAAAAAAAVASSSNREPIYIVISTNPLILLPFSWNPITSAMEPMVNASSAGINLPPGSNAETLGSQIAPLPSTPIIFPNGMPQMLDQRTPQMNFASLSKSAQRFLGTNGPTSPYVTTFSNLRNQLDMLNTTGDSSLHHHHQQRQASQLLNSLIEDKAYSGKKRPLTETDSDQPLDLSSSSNSTSSKNKRAKECHFEQENSNDNCTIQYFDNKDEPKDAEFQKNVLQKFALNNPEHPMPMNPFVVAGSSKSTDNLAAMVRDNPTFASYFAMAVAALSQMPPDANFGSVAPPAPIATPASTPQVDVVVKQGNSRCTECNIVFYKHENYLVHKEQYCASRRNIDPSKRSSSTSSSINNNRTSSPLASNSQRTNPAASGESKADQSLSVSTSPSVLSSREAASVSPSSLISPNKQSTVFQYYCVACGIKYTSYDNLQAHQKHYCKRNNTAAGASATNVNTIAKSVSPANPLSSPSPVPFSAQQLLTPQLLSTVAAAAGLGPQTSNPEAMLDFSSVDSLSSNFNALMAAAVAKSNLVGPPPPPPSGATFGGDFNCSKCKASYVSQETLAAHVCSADFRVVEKTEKSPNVTPSTSSLQTYKCTICGYKGHTMRGMRTHVRVHNAELASGGCEEDFIVQNTDLPEPSNGRRGANHGNSLANVARHRRRSAASIDGNYIPHSTPSQAESIDRGYLDSRRRDIDTGGSNDASGGNSGVQTHKCQYCPYASNYKGNVMRHVKLVHKVIKDTNLLPPSKDSLPENHMAADNDETNSLKSDGCDPERETPKEETETVTEPPKSPANVAELADVDSKYCSSCNISFTYRNSYLAHKKYYCSSHNTDP